ncbi:MAG: hypothetical protein KIT60_10980 [Burkholderiaceae bacterium]|nr:hypothetical protein [Burkholderiaceae bacterium]
MKRHEAARASWMRRLWITLTMCIGLLAACGGGVGTGGTGAFASGPISGFGSIIVNNVRYDDSSARIESDDGGGRSRSDLRLGMVVEIDSDAVRGQTATAQRVLIVSELIGRVDAVGPDSLVVNGLTVRTNAGTVFDGTLVGGLSGVAVGMVVEVYGLTDGATGHVVATRVEPRPGASAFKFRGTVSALDTQARTFRIGSQVMVYSAQTPGRDQLSDGALVRIAVQQERDAMQRWIVLSINGTAPQLVDGQDVKTEGLITHFESAASFRVGRWTVDASTAEVEGGTLSLGQRVKLQGRLRGSVVIADKVEVVAPDGDDDYETSGRIVAIDPVARFFDLQGNRGRVSFARGDLEIKDGTLDMLVVGRRVKVKGTLSADGTLLEAREIEFANDDDDDRDDEGDDGD